MSAARPIFPRPRLPTVSQRAIPQHDSTQSFPTLPPRLSTASITPGPPNMLVAQEAELNQLRASHATLSSQVARLADDITATREEMRSDISVLRKDSSQSDMKCRRRVALFARKRAIRALKKDRPEFIQVRPSWCRGNAVIQSQIQSQASDCTLHEFRLFAADILKRSDINCTMYPSSYYVLFGKSSRYEIFFHTFSDICEALDIDITHREAAVYREKSTKSRTLRAVQLLGVDLVTKTCTEGVEKESRCILLGRSMLEVSAHAPTRTLVQSTTRWHGPGFEEGFHLSNDPAPKISSNAREAATRGRSSDIANPAPEARIFSIVWDKLPDVEIEMIASADDVPGVLRSVFPAVIVRTSKLISTAQRAFSTRIQGKFLKQILVSPQPQGEFQALQEGRN